MAEQDQDRTEDATQHKLDEARKKGSVAKSQEVQHLATLTALTMSLFALGGGGWQQLAVLSQRLLGGAGRLVWQADVLAAWLAGLLLAALMLLAPFLATVMLIQLLSSLAQTGVVFSVHPLLPDMDRINPASGFQRLFSLRTLFEAFKSVCKLVILSGVVYLVIADVVPGLAGLADADPRQYPALMLRLLGNLLIKLVLAMLVIGGADFLFTRFEFSKRMRMSKRDIKDEHKNREGDPRIRSRLRELRKEMLKRATATRRLPEADVLITNPTHLAVALRYEHGKSGAPQLVAKGAGELALKMRQVAARHRIPIVENRVLARTLFREVEFDDYVPEKLYPQIAKIMVWVYAMRKRAGQS